MTLKQFEQRLKKIDPKFRVKPRGYGDITGIFHGSDYVCRATKGELNLNGYRFKYFNSDMSVSYGTIQKRGRKTLVNIIAQRFHLNTKQRAYLLWGV